MKPTTRLHLIGVDVVSISRLERALERSPGLQRVLFHDEEIEYSYRKARPIQHLAARFAAKEAVFKALGVGWPEVSWHDVTISSTDSGPLVQLSGKAAHLHGAAGPIAASLSHDGNFAVAAVLVQDTRRRRSRHELK